jgi:hypothetical protein
VLVGGRVGVERGRRIGSAGLLVEEIRWEEKLARSSIDGCIEGKDAVRTKMLVWRCRDILLKAEILISQSVRRLELVTA